jgi:hypothetical protein
VEYEEENMKIYIRMQRIKMKMGSGFMIDHGLIYHAGGVRLHL